MDRKAAPNQDNVSLIAVRVHAGKTAFMSGDRQNQASNATEAMPDRKRETEVMASMVHGTLIGQVKNKTPAAPIVVIHRPAWARASRPGLGTLATLFVVLVLVCAVFFVFLFDVLTPRIPRGANGEATKQAPAPRLNPKNDAKG